MTAPFYPLFLNLQNLSCVVIGFGAVGRRKIAGLLTCQPKEIKIFDLVEPRLAEQLELLKSENVHFVQKQCQREDLLEAKLVFITTDNEEENQRLVKLCKELNCFCNVGTDPLEGDFFLPATARRGKLALAIGTNGASPALARRWRQELEIWLEPRTKFLELMDKLRPLILNLGYDSEENTKIFRSLAYSQIQENLENADLVKCELELKAILPEELHHYTKGLLNAID